MIKIYMVLLGIDVWSDWYRIKFHNMQIKHGHETLLAMFLYLAFAYVAGHTRYHSWWFIGQVLIMVPALRWILHDLLLNILRELPFDYLGSEQQSATTDKLLNRLAAKGWNQWAIKLGTLVVSIVLCIILELIKNLVR